MSSVVVPRRLSTLNVDEVYNVLQNMNIDIPKEILESNKIDGETLSLAENAEELLELNITLPSLKLKLLLKKIEQMKGEGVPDSVLGKRQREIVDLSGELPRVATTPSASSSSSLIDIVQTIGTNLAHSVATNISSKASSNQVVFELAEKYKKENNKVEALKLFKFAADNGHADAMYNVGLLYKSPKNKANTNIEECKRYFQMAADAGHTEANFSLAKFYDNGTGLPKEEASKAFEHYRLASLKGHADAHFKLHKLFKEGWGTRKNKTESIRHLKLSAELGSVNGIGLIGVYYVNGIDMKVDKARGMEYFLSAANKGHSQSKYNLGTCYTSGAELNYATAFEWFKQSADQNHLDAQYKVAEYLYEGKGVEANKSLAYNYCKKAADRGLSNAKQKLTEWFADYSEV